ncbi:hypothetical protein KVR01_009033 [Diaporthe batatas]|uniref:uncharacterized protein n=1 Tax=Diaporthe batatas TaxID=748121 RepID=UPI001D05325D|nr:uncharacterized protein KVR01_009033 [Diaporthe batatas]KAG8160769.1 hypothetical protein KVR01_009033 [Diaporthe batatas]
MGTPNAMCQVGRVLDVKSSSFITRRSIVWIRMGSCLKGNNPTQPYCGHDANVGSKCPIQEACRGLSSAEQSSKK